MVSVSLTPRKGNYTKFFPHSGHLGLTPVVVAGTLKLELTAEDANHIQVAEILVRLRCYEAIGGQAQINEHAISETHPPENLNLLWETVSTAWSASDVSCIPQKLIGDYQTEWKLVVPRSATNFSNHGFAVGSMTYKNWKSWWQLEAVVRLANKKKTITKCYPLHLKNFHPMSSLGTLTHVQGSSYNSNIRYSLSHPAQVSCGDVVTVNVSLNADPGRTFKFKKVIITLERSFAVDKALEDKTNVVKFPNHSIDTTSSTCLLSDASESCKPKENSFPKLRYTRSLGRLRSRSQSTRSPSRPPPVRKPVVSIIQITEIPFPEQDRLALNNSASPCNGRVDLVIPRPKSSYHYSIGDTCKTKFVSVTYHIKAQVLIKTKKGNNETIELGSSEVELSSVPTLDRESADRNYKKFLVVPRFGKSKEIASVISPDSQSDCQLVNSKITAPSTLTV